jgi:arylsulfatase A-like enzyme
MKKPNILFITSDQQRGDCYGFEKRKVKTPHLDELASKGTRFKNCITPNTVCMPARSSMLTGLLPRTHGVSDNGIDLNPNTGEKGFGRTFANNGYKSGFIGKLHFSSNKTFEPTGTPECRFSISKLGPNWFGPYMGFDHVETMVGGHYAGLDAAIPSPPNAHHYERWLHDGGMGNKRNEEYRTKLPPNLDIPQTWNSGLPVAFHNSTWVGNQTIEFIKKNQKNPFVLWTSFPDPHTPFNCPEPWCYMHHPDEVDLPENPDMPDKGLVSHRAKWSRVFPPEEKKLRHLISNYYGMISLIDHNVGRIINALNETGISENTLIIYTADHGEWLGDHGLLLKGPIIYESLLRVGCIMKGPNIPQNLVVEDPVSTLDIPATFYDYANISKPMDLNGKSLMGLLQNKDNRDFAYNEWDLRSSRTGLELNLRVVRTKDAKLIYEEISGTGEMYLLSEDPGEMDNVYNDPAFSKIQKELMDMINSRPNDALPKLEQVAMS